MKLKVFSIYDSKVGAYMKPFYAHSAGEAMRTVVDASSGQDNMLSRHPGDFTLFELGVYDDQSGQFAQLEAKINLGTIIELRGPQAETVDLFRSQTAPKGAESVVQ